MNPRNITEITKADQLLKSAEATFPSENSSRDFEEAFELLNDYVATEEPAPDILKFIGNLKYSYARIVLKRLNEIETEDIDKFFRYFLLTVRMKEEFSELKAARPDLEIAFRKCVDRFGPQLDEVFKIVRKNA